MEQQKSPVDVAASIPDKENPYADFITIVAHKSILDPLQKLGDAQKHARGHLYDFGLMRCATGTYLNLYFSGDEKVLNPFTLDKNAVPDTVSIPYAVAMLLLRNFCVMAKSPVFADGEEIYACIQSLTVQDQ